MPAELYTPQNSRAIALTWCSCPTHRLHSPCSPLQSFLLLPVPLYTYLPLLLPCLYLLFFSCLSSILLLGLLVACGYLWLPRRPNKTRQQCLPLPALIERSLDRQCLKPPHLHFKTGPTRSFMLSSNRRDGGHAVTCRVIAAVVPYCLDLFYVHIITVSCRALRRCEDNRSAAAEAAMCTGRQRPTVHDDVCCKYRCNVLATSIE